MVEIISAVAVKVDPVPLSVKVVPAADGKMAQYTSEAVGTALSRLTVMFVFGEFPNVGTRVG